MQPLPFGNITINFHVSYQNNSALPYWISNLDLLMSQTFLLRILCNVSIAEYRKCQTIQLFANTITAKCDKICILRNMIQFYRFI